MLSEQLGRHISISSRFAPASFLRVSGSHRALGLKWQSHAASPEGPVSETNRVEATMKRFWKTVGIEKRGDALAVTLDSRPLKTPFGNTLLLPKTKFLLASLIAAEWDHQTTLLKPHALPVTSIASRAIDGLSEKKTRDEVQSALLQYLDTDAVCFYQGYPPQLVTLQTKYWDPLHQWARETFEVEINKSESLLFNSQPEATKEKLGQVLDGFDRWEIAALERATYASKSLIIGLALVKKHLTADQASLAAQVEVASQVERWGEVEDTHDVDYHDIRRQLGSAACLMCCV